jgi:hypothetical protein
MTGSGSDAGPPGGDTPWWARPEGGEAPSWWSEPGGAGQAPPAGPGGPDWSPPRPDQRWQEARPVTGMPFAARPDPTFAQTYSPRPVGRAKGAVAALVWGILAVACCGIIGGAIAIYQGSQARYRIRAANGRLSGNGLALAGMLLGALGIVESIIGLWAAFNGHRFGVGFIPTTTTTP